MLSPLAIGTRVHIGPWTTPLCPDHCANAGVIVDTLDSEYIVALQEGQGLFRGGELQVTSAPSTTGCSIHKAMVAPQEQLQDPPEKGTRR